MKINPNTYESEEQRDFRKEICFIAKYLDIRASRVYIDQYGLFMSREESYQVAKEAGQILPRHEWGETLYSESLY